jgi:hypothetical protein
LDVKDRAFPADPFLRDHTAPIEGAHTALAHAKPAGHLLFQGDFTGNIMGRADVLHKAGVDPRLGNLANMFLQLP